MALSGQQHFAEGLDEPRVASMETRRQFVQTPPAAVLGVRAIAGGVEVEVDVVELLVRAFDPELIGAEPDDATLDSPA